MPVPTRPGVPDGHSLIALAIDTGHGIRLDSFERAKGYVLHLAGIVDADAVMAVPLSDQNGPRGGLVVSRQRSRHPFARSTWTWPGPSPARRP